MKIGIVTFWNSNDNYGQILQVFALYKYLESLGHHCFIVKYSEKRNSTYLSRIVTFIRLIGNPKDFIASIKRIYKSRSDKIILIDRHFNDFRDKWMQFSKEYTHKELKITPPVADAFVCGSDQIWGGLDSVMYLSFVPKTGKKIAFAPSFGGIVPNLYVRYKIKKYIQTFDFISCRENSGVELCRLLGRNDALLFPDPTLMHLSNFYDKIITSTPSKKQYIFVYLLGNEMDFDTEQIFDYAKSRGLDIMFITGQKGNFPNIKQFPATIEEWLSGIKNAKYVITNSFHGTVFSLLYHKKFLTVPLSGAFSRMNVRINELLCKYNLLNRIYSGQIDVISEEIDYSTFDFLQNQDIENVNIIMKKIL